MKVGKDPANRGTGKTGPFTFDEVTMTSSFVPELQVCPGGSKIGEMCAYRSAAPDAVKCFASSATTIDVEWKAATAQGEGLLTGYRVTAFALDEQVSASINSTAETRMTFSLDAANVNQRVKRGFVYTVTVEALYANATILSKVTSCQVPQAGLPCIPGRSNGEQSPVCECKKTEYHTKGMPPSVADSPQQLDGGMGGPARDWACEACLEGTACTGGTTSTVTVQPGWFVLRSVSNVTGAEQRPVLWRCPGGAVSCPGGASIMMAMGAAPATAGTVTRTCESITNTTGLGAGVGTRMERDVFDAARLWTYPQCQCGPGGTGLLCRTCKSSAVLGGNDWVGVRGIGGGCRECTMRTSDATTMVGVTTFGILFLVLCAALFKWRYTRPSLVEMRFVGAFRHINTLGATKIVEEFFGVKVGSGITRDVFVAAVIRRCGGKDKGGGSRSGGGGGVVNTNALKLWRKLDENDDGEATLDEFVTFVCELRDGKKGAGAQSRIGKTVVAFAGSMLKWWESMKSQTLRAVIITHFQVSSLRPMNIFTRTYTLIRSFAH